MIIDQEFINDITAYANGTNRGCYFQRIHTPDGIVSTNSICFHNGGIEINIKYNENGKITTINGIDSKNFKCENLEKAICSNLRKSFKLNYKLETLGGENKCDEPVRVYP